MPIQILPEDVVARIAAGEAVERPASAAKELIENAIDAGATSIQVEVSGGGRRLLRISDNGIGMRSEDAKLAFRRHATSKLRNAEELQALKTLGFRGEALASLAAVSQARIVTRHREDTMGVMLESVDGRLQSKGVGAPAGTIVTIEHLFYNTPARLKFLKNDSTEKRHIYWVVARYAMAYPAIAFVLKQDGRERLHTSGSGKLADVVATVYGPEAFKRMAPVEADGESRPGRTRIDVKGFTSLPELNRARRDRIILFVNGRAIQDSALTHAVIQAYEGLLKAGTFPLAVLLISTPSDFVDVNVHPTKAEVRFREPQQVFLVAQRAVREALQASGDGDTVARTDLWSGSGFSDQYLDYTRPKPDWRRIEGDELFDDAGLSYIPDVADQPVKPRTLPVLRVVGQVGATYIVSEGPAGLYLIDQNAAHERIVHEEICEELRAGDIAGQRLGESQTVMLSPNDSDLLASVSDILSKLGFEIEIFGPNTFVIRAMPAHAKGIEAGDLLPRMLDHLRRSKREIEDGVAALASAAALRRGQVMPDEDMRVLVAKLERCPDPLTSPSGRRVLIHLSSEQLADEFGRG
ncbi:MAG: DNA mismatch repair endonuclease MutL [Chloroflexi bacterium]|nr:DNA mismatch repair endonuclease MutL [Chloroflexota bacterium]